MTTVAALLLGTAGAFAQNTSASATTAPVGFVTHTLQSGQFNLIGVTLHQPILTTGTFTATAATTITNTNTNFSNILTTGVTYILEITEATNTDLIGVTQDITTWAGSGITTGDNLAAQGLVAGDQYQIRRAATIADIFGETNSANLPASASVAASAQILIQDPASADGFSRYYYNTGGFGQGAAWQQIQPNGGAEIIVEADEVVIPYVDAIFVQMPSGVDDVDIVITGSVKLTATTIALTGNFNYVSTGFPVGSTLQNSDLEDTLAVSASPAGSDIIWIQQANGSYSRYYYNSGGFGVAATWRLINDDGSETDIDEDVAIPTSIIIQRNGEALNVSVEPGY